MIDTQQTLIRGDMLDLSPWLECHIGESSTLQGNAKGDSRSSIVCDAKPKKPDDSRLHIHFARTTCLIQNLQPIDFKALEMSINHFTSFNHSATTFS